MQAVLSVLGASLACAADPSRDALAIMNRVAANVAQATDARRQYVYRQKVRSAMVRTNG